MDRHPIHQAALRERVVFGGAVLGTAVIPHEDIPHKARHNYRYISAEIKRPSSA
jgi:hypothetical protein